MVPKMRRVICSRLRPDRQRRVLSGWELAIDKTGGYLYSRALLAGLSAFFHWILFQAIGIQAPVAMALWVGLISQFLPVVGTYIAGALPVLVQFVDSPPKALVILIFVIVYQQVENYFLLPRITARTMDLHPAIAFGSAIAGGAVLGCGRCGAGDPGRGHGAGRASATSASATRSSTATSPARCPGKREARRSRLRGSSPGRPMATPEAFVPVAITTRSGFDESVHFGAVVGVGRDGSIELTVGDPATAIYARSSNKPMQAVAMVRAGLQLPSELLALVCASHDGTPTHLAVVRQILATGGLDEGLLGNTPDLPLDEDAAEAVLRAGGRPHRAADELQRQAQRHVGDQCAERLADRRPLPRRRASLAAADHRDDRRARRRAALPHRCRRLRIPRPRVLARRSGSSLSVDRHGEPASAGDAVYECMTAHPEMVGGEDRDVTQFMRSVPGLMAKDGADGVFAAALPDGRAVAVEDRRRRQPGSAARDGRRAAAPWASTSRRSSHWWSSRSSATVDRVGEVRAIAP